MTFFLFCDKIVYRENVFGGDKMKLTTESLKQTSAVFLTLIIMLSLFSLCGCSSDNTEKTRLEICMGLSLDSVPEFTVVDSIEHYQGDGTKEVYYVLEFSEESAAQFAMIADRWQKEPVVTTFAEFTDYVHILPFSEITQARDAMTIQNETEGVKYIFINKTSEFKTRNEERIREYTAKNNIVSGKNKSKTTSQSGYSVSDSDPRVPDHCIGFACAFWNKEEKRLYYYHIDPAVTDENIALAAVI